MTIAKLLDKDIEETTLVPPFFDKLVTKVILQKEEKEVQETKEMTRDTADTDNLPRNKGRERAVRTSNGTPKESATSSICSK